MAVRMLLQVGVFISIAVYLVCLSVPAIHIYGSLPDHPSSEMIHGYDTLFLGVFTFLNGNFGWGANIALFASWFLALRNKPAPSLCTSIIALTMLFDTLRFNTAGGIKDKYGCCIFIKTFDSGFYLWILSIAVMVILSCIAAYIKAKTPNGESVNRPGF